MEKLVPQWNDKYSINDVKIDAEHQQLFNIAAKVEDIFYQHAKRDELKDILTELFNYMSKHFAHEEEYMQELEYPYLNEHRIMHKEITNDMSHLIQHIKTTNDLKEKLYTMISKWLLDHILHHDIMISKWIQEQKRRAKEMELEINEEEEITAPVIEPKFIYSCPCNSTHILNYKEHIEISCNKKMLRCKKCQKNIFYVRSEMS